MTNGKTVVAFLRCTIFIRCAKNIFSFSFWFFICLKGTFRSIFFPLARFRSFALYCVDVFLSFFFSFSSCRRYVAKFRVRLILFNLLFYFAIAAVIFFFSVLETWVYIYIYFACLSVRSFAKQFKLT